MCLWLNLSYVSCLVSYVCRYIATGDAQQTISYSFRLGKATVFNIIYETCDAIWNILQEEMIVTPTSSHEWIAVADAFETLWNFPQCVGALDGKHVTIQAPPGSGSLYYNYKGSFSIVLLAMCDAEYCFTMVDIGAAGSESDGGVFSHCALAHMLERNSLHLPQMATLPMSDVSAPYVIVADAAFPLKTYLLKPYPQRKLDAKKEIFNYRLSRARRIIENTFGIMSNRWRIFRRPLIALPKNAVRITKAACVLHNFLQRADNNNGGTARHYCPSGYTDTYDNDGNVILGQWRNDASGGDLVSLSGTSGNRSSRDAARVRDILADYFVSPQGEVAWQYKHTTDALRI